MQKEKLEMIKNDYGQTLALLKEIAAKYGKFEIKDKYTGAKMLWNREVSDDIGDYLICNFILGEVTEIKESITLKYITENLTLSFDLKSKELYALSVTRDELYAMSYNPPEKGNTSRYNAHVYEGDKFITQSFKNSFGGYSFAKKNFRLEDYICF